MTCSKRYLAECELQDAGNLGCSESRCECSCTFVQNYNGLSIFADHCLFHGSCSSKFGLCNEAERSCIRL